MTAARFIARSWRRKHGHTWIALGLVFGITLGAATVAAAGAKRADTAYPRFIAQQAGYDVVLGGMASDDPVELAKWRTQILAMPEVLEGTTSTFVSDSFRVRRTGITIAFPDSFVMGDPAGKDGIDMNRWVVTEGRSFDPRAADEAILERTAAERLGLRVGDALELRIVNPETGEQLTPAPAVRLVGTVVIPNSLPAIGTYPLTPLVVAKGFFEKYPAAADLQNNAPSVRLRDGIAGIPAFLAKLVAAKISVDVPTTLPRHLASVQKTLRFEILGLWALAALLVLAGLAIIGQSVARQARQEGEDADTLRAIGLSRRDFVLAGLIRAGVIGAVAAVTTVVIGIAGSPLTPIGLTRVVEPNPGIWIDPAILGMGAGLALAACAVFSILPAIRAMQHRDSTPTRPALLAGSLARRGASPSVVAGVRLAFDPGRGSRAVPVRSVVIGTVVGVASLVAAFTFSRSLQHLIDTPALTGYTYDVIAGPDDSDEQLRMTALLKDDPDVAAYSFGGVSNVAVAGKDLLPFTYQADSSITPLMLEGRAPRRDDEIALGANVLRVAGKKIGDTILVGTTGEEEDAKSQLMTIVGRPAVPPFFFQEVEPGDASAITQEGYYLLAPSERRAAGEEPAIIKYKDGVDVRKKVSELRAAAPNIFVLQIADENAALTALRRSQSVPLALTVSLLLMSTATLIHMLITSVRRRRRDLAVLKTLGFTSEQIRATVLWQTTSLVSVALVIGIPLGLVAGRRAWGWFTESVGVVPAIITPILAAAVILPLAALIFANVMTLPSARSAARTQAAVVLRAE